MKKKYLALALSVALGLGAIFTGFSATNLASYAAGEEQQEHDYVAYQIFTYDIRPEDGKYENVDWGTGANAGVQTALFKELSEKGFLKNNLDELITDQSKATPLDYAKAISLNITDTYFSTDSFDDFGQGAEVLASLIADQITDATPYFNVNADGTITDGKIGWYLLVDVTEFPDDETKAFYSDRAQLQNYNNGFTINSKHDTITIIKKVRDINDSTYEGKVHVGYDGWSESADYDIGDTIPFQITGTLPGDFDTYTEFEYVFRDKASTGLTFQEDSVEVYIDREYDQSGKNVTKEGTKIEKDSQLYTVKQGSDNTKASYDDTLAKGEFVISFDNLKNVPGVNSSSKIVVEYSSILNGEGIKYGVPGNPNDARIEFSNDKGGKGRTPWSTAIVFTFQPEIDKVDKYGEALAGAEFTLEKLASEFVDGKYTILKDEAGNEIVVKSYDIKVQDQTKFFADGIDDGVYKITETKVPDGYNGIDPIYFVVKATHDGGKLTKLEVVDLTNKTMLSDDGTGVFNIPVPEKMDKIQTKVVNNEGVVLPSTGGIGTTIFYVVGGVLVVGAVVLLIVRRKMRTEEE